MIYIKNEVKTQTIYIPRTELDKEAFDTTIKTYEDGIIEGFEKGKNHQKDQLLNLYVTENGLYEREDGWGRVEVAFEEREPKLQDKNININDEQTTVTYDEGYDGLSTVNVNAETYGEQKRNEGYGEGHSEGYSEGFNKGNEEGYTQGKNEGYNEGKTEGYDEGYSQGNSEGYDQGYKDGKLEDVNITNKVIEINSNGGTNYNANDEGADGWENVTVMVNVPTEFKRCNLQNITITENGHYEPIKTQYSFIDTDGNAVYDTGYDFSDEYGKFTYSNNVIVEVLFSLGSDYYDGQTLLGCEKGYLESGKDKYENEWDESTFGVRYRHNSLEVAVGQARAYIPFTPSDDEWQKLHKLSISRNYGVYFDDVFIQEMNFALCPWTPSRKTLYIGGMHNEYTGDKNGVKNPWKGYISNVNIYSNETLLHSFEPVNVGKMGEYKDTVTGAILPNLMGDGKATYGCCKEYGEFDGFYSIDVNVPQEGGNCDEAYNNGYNDGFEEGKSQGGGGEIQYNPIADNYIGYINNGFVNMNFNNVEYNFINYNGDLHFIPNAYNLAEMEEFRVKSTFRGRNNASAMYLFGVEDDNLEYSKFAACIENGKLILTVGQLERQYDIDENWHTIEIGYNSSESFVYFDGELTKTDMVYNRPNLQFYLGALNRNGEAVNGFYGSIGAVLLNTPWSETVLMPFDETSINIYSNNFSYVWITVGVPSSGYVDREYFNLPNGLKSLKLVAYPQQ